MIRKFLGNYRADWCFENQRLTAVMPTKHEAWQSLIEIVAIEAKQC